MSKVLKVVAKVAGVVAIAAAVVFAVTGNPALAALALKVAAIASAVSTVASVGAELLSKKPPPMGSVNQVVIGHDQPTPVVVGRTYLGGARVYQNGYGPTVDDIPNPYLLLVDVFSGAGPVKGLEGVYADFEPIPISGGAASGYFGGFLWIDSQIGTIPEPSALQPQWPGAPGWDASAGLSGYAAIAWSMKFDKKGKVFASGPPQTGAIWEGQLCYDPRKDSTYFGGAGVHRWAAPTDTAAHDAARATFEYTRSPGLLGLWYALGAFHRDTRVAGSTYQKVGGVGIPIDGVIVDDFVHLANVCDANGWYTDGVVYEPGDRWANLKNILAAGGAEPLFRGGKLGLKISAPRVPLDTITEDDLADGTISVGAMQGYEQRLNTLVPKYRSEAHKWEYVQTTDPVSIASYVAEDGEVKQEERQINLCQDPTQATQLCAYELMDRRELGDIEISCKPRLRRYGPGDLLIVALPEAGLDMQPCVVLKRSVDPATMAVSFVLRGETAAKHAFALGQTGRAPPTPALLGTQALDDLASALSTVATGAKGISARDPLYPVTSTATSVSIAAFSGTVSGGIGVMQFPAATLPATASSVYDVFWSLSGQAYQLVAAPGLDAFANPDLVFLEQVGTADGTTGDYPATETPPGGYRGSGGGYNGAQLQ